MFMMDAEGKGVRLLLHEDDHGQGHIRRRGKAVFLLHTVVHHSGTIQHPELVIGRENDFLFLGVLGEEADVASALGIDHKLVGALEV